MTRAQNRKSENSNKYPKKPDTKEYKLFYADEIPEQEKPTVAESSPQGAREGGDSGRWAGFT